MVDELEEEVAEGSKVKCLNIKNLLRSILGKNKLSRPRPPSPPPPPPPVGPASSSHQEHTSSSRRVVVYKRRPKRSEAESSTAPNAEEYVHGPSQPLSTGQTGEIEEEEEENESSPEQHLERRKKRTPLEVRRLRK